MPYSYEPFKDYQRKKDISDAKERAEAKANTELSIYVYKHFGASGPITKRQISQYLKKDKHMDNIETPNTLTPEQLADLAAGKSVTVNVTVDAEEPTQAQ